MQDDDMNITKTEIDVTNCGLRIKTLKKFNKLRGGFITNANADRKIMNRNIRSMSLFGRLLAMAIYVSCVDNKYNKDFIFFESK